MSEAPQVERRLAAIVAADVVGYSRLMGRDEEGTLARLNAARREAIDPAVARFRGRVVKTSGDGLLLEFASVVDAVRAALEVQQAMAVRAAAETPERRLALRIGVNLGDVIVEDGDLYGDGVNVAARLEQLAEPGGICLSRAVRDQLRDRLDLPLEDLGEVAVKNILRPVRAFRLRVGGAPVLQVPPRRGRRALALAAAAFVVLALTGGGWWFLRDAGEAPAPRPSQQAGTQRLSIVVLPFANLSGDAGQDWFADGLTEDLITDLSRISGAFVIARNTAFTYKGRSVDVRQVAQELGVRYVLEGSVRRAGEQVRVNVQLIDAQTGAHVWADRLDRAAKDVFALQNEVTGRIARALNLELLEAESRRAARGGPANPDAHDLALQGWILLLNKPQTRETNEAAQKLVEAALALDPNSALAWTALTYLHTRAASFGWSASRDESMRLSVEAGERAVELDPRSSDAAYMLGYALRTSGQTERSMPAMDRAIALNPNNPLPYHGLAYGSILLGRAADALPLLERAFQLSPREPLAAVWHWTASYAHLLLGDDAAAFESARKAIGFNPRYPNSHWVLAAAAAHRGDVAAAQAAVAEYLKVAGVDDTVGKVYARMSRLSADPVYRAQLERLVEGLRKAGLPE